MKLIGQTLSDNSKWLFIICLLSAGSYAQGSDFEVYFAGVAYSGNAAALGSTNSRISEALDESTTTRLIGIFREHYENIPNREIQLISDRLGNLDGSTSQLALALSIDRESISVERLLDNYKIVIEIAAQLLLFDYSSGMLLLSVPVTPARNDLVSELPDEGYIEENLLAMLVGEGENSLPRLFAVALGASTIPGPALRRIQITSLGYEDLPPEHQSAISDKINSGVLGYEITKILAKTLNVPVLPHSGGQAVGQAIPARFSDGTVYNFQLPNPDYEIRIALTNTLIREMDDLNGVDQFLLGSYFDIDVIEPLSGRNYFSQSLRQGVTKTWPGGGEFDYSQSLYETILLGFASFANGVLDPRSDWVSSQEKSRDVRRDLREFQKLIEELQ